MRSHDEACKILSKIEELTKPSNKGPRVWSDHLAKYLEEYMACVEDMLRDDNLGLMALSFVQAGRMVESSSKVYGANIDYVWQLMTEVLEVLRINQCSKSNAKRSEAPAETAEGSESREGPQKRRKRAVFKDFEEIVVNVIDPDMKASERNEPIKPLPLQHIVTKLDWKRLKSSYKIVDVDGDTIVPSDYSVMLQTSRDGKLQTNMLKEVISECSEAVSTTQQNTREMIHFLELLIKELGHGDASPGSNEDPALANPVSQGTTSECASTELPEHPLPVTPPTSPEPVMSSVSDVETPERIKRSLSETGSEKEVCAAAYSARRSGEKEHLVTVPHDLCEPVALEDSINEKPLKRRHMFNMPFDFKMHKSDGRKHKLDHTLRMELIVKYQGEEVLRTYVKEALLPLCADLEQFYLAHMTERLLLQDHPKVFSTYRDREDCLDDLSKEYDEDFFGFEDREPALGEDEEEEEFRGWPCEEEAVGSQNRAAREDSRVTVPPPVATSHGREHSVLGQTQSSPGTAHEDTEAGIARRVAEWEHYIRPKLKVAHDRGHFDIHKIETEILKSFPQSSARVTLQFEQFAANKPMADIPRYFLASLELANTHNIEISQESHGDLPMDCMHMTLLSPVRHHEVLQDYEAPSQGAKHKHISQVVERNNGNGDKSSGRSVCNKKHKRVIRDSASSGDDGDRSWRSGVSNKKRKHVSRAAGSSSVNRDESSSRRKCKKKHKRVGRDSASSGDDGDSSRSSGVSNKKRKHIVRAAASSSDTDGDSVPSISVCIEKHNKR